jgi:hypothetical protein
MVSTSAFFVRNVVSWNDRTPPMRLEAATRSSSRSSSLTQGSRPRCFVVLPTAHPYRSRRSELSPIIGVAERSSAHDRKPRRCRSWRTRGTRRCPPSSEPSGGIRCFALSAALARWRLFACGGSSSPIPLIFRA